jgi:hypothetical protein
MTDNLSNILAIILALMGVCIFVGIIGLLMLARSIRRLHIPADADFFTTMRHIPRHIPLALAVLLDLLDFGLDIFSAPILWIALDRMGLPSLRNKATIEALIPLTNVIHLGAPLLPAYDYDDWDRPYTQARRKPEIIDVNRR